MAKNIYFGGFSTAVPTPGKLQFVSSCNLRVVEMQRKLLLGARTPCNGLHNYHVTLHLHAKLASKLRVLDW